MFGKVVTAVVVVMISVVGIHEVEAVPDASLDDFPSPYVKDSSLLDLMKTYFDISVNQIISSKQYGSQFAEKTGLAKVLAEESDRHWENGLDTIKEYLEIGGMVDNNFKSKFIFGPNFGPLSMNGVDPLNTKYLETLKLLMTNSRDLITEITREHNVAIKKVHTETLQGNKDGDAEVARFLLEKVEKESEMAYKMANNYFIFHSIQNNGVACNIFDKNL